MPARASTPLAVLVLGLGLALGVPAAAKAVEPSPTVVRMADWITRSDDNDDLPFVIIDKASARVFVYDADGEMLGADMVLIGLTPGDDSTPGVGDRELSDIPPEDRTTPAGRFVASYGPAAGKREDVLWVDFATAISLHAVVTTNPDEKRVERLKSPTADDNRITFGCINVSRKFYKTVIRPTLTDRGVFYILPDKKDLAEVFPNFWQSEFAVRSDATLASSAPRGPRHPSGWW